MYTIGICDAQVVFEIVASHLGRHGIEYGVSQQDGVSLLHDLLKRVSLILRMEGERLRIRHVHVLADVLPLGRVADPQHTRCLHRKL